MKLLQIALVLSLYVITIDCWVAKVRYDPEEFQKNNISDTDAYCFSTRYGRVNQGETKQLEKRCAKAMCLGDRSISIHGCGSLGAEPPCYVTKGDLSQPHPKCCPKIECPDVI